MTFVTVYRFKIWNSDIGDFVVSLRLGTRAAIEMSRGEIIKESAREVPVSDINARGFTAPDPLN
jgi:hypothetical protein